MTDATGDTGTLKPYREIPGNSVGDKCKTLGIVPGGLVPLSRLQEIQNECRIAVYLFFDERIARHSTMQDDMENYSVLPPKARPYLELHQFYMVIEEEGLELLDGGAVSAEVVAVGELECASCGGVRYEPYIRALLFSGE